jgi:catechol 2,3-dioxygenase-like lactoylglutathione lyase family enzyme
MMIAIDHIAIPARDVVASARFLSEILGVASAVARGPEGEMRWLAVGESGALLFTPADTVASQHVAFRVDEVTFAGVVDRLRARGITFGNHPEAPTNEQTADPFGGHGRVYFADPNGHFFEVIA